MVRVLLAGDDVSVSQPLARALRREGYVVEVRERGHSVLECATAHDIDLLVLDLGRPGLGGLDGLELCRQLRAQGIGAPVLILTGRAPAPGTVTSAGRCRATPDRLGAVLGRIRAILRLGGADIPVAATVLQVREVRVDTAARRAWVGDRQLTLTAKEFDLLRVLVRDAGHVVTREQLMREVWETEWWGPTKTLDMHMSWLRRKLGDDAAKPRFIVTVRGVGFRFEPG